MAAASFSELSTHTANEIDCEFPKPSLRVLLKIDEFSIAGSGSRFAVEKFVYESFNFFVHYETDPENKKTNKLWLSAVATCPAEYSLLYQLRVRVGRGGDEDTHVVDRLVAQFEPNGRPLTISIQDEKVDVVKIEMRTINKFFWPHPLFNVGDLDIIFESGSCLRVWKAVLAQASSYFHQTLAEDPTITAINVGSFPVNQMVELLFQLYPTARPVYSDINTLAPAAVGFYVNSILYSIGHHLVHYRFKSMSMEEKWKMAMDLELVEALQQLVALSVESGHWDHKLSAGWQPSQFFSANHYNNLVAPVVAAARQNNWKGLADPWKQPDYFHPGLFKTTLVFRATRFYVPTGIFNLHGSGGFEKKEDGSLNAQYTYEMEVVCAQMETVPGAVLLALFNSLLPGGPPVPAQMLRAALVFCHDHMWQQAKEKIEQRLQLEPPKSAGHFAQQMIFAERFQLYNMLRSCLFRAESSALGYAGELSSRGFLGVSNELRGCLVDRLCAGWSLFPKMANPVANRKPTEEMDREVAEEKAGPAEAVNDTPTMAEIVSEYVFGPLADFTKEEEVA